MARQPLYLRIADDLRRRIESGELPQGSQLPAQLELGDRYEASRNTIRDAIKRLTSQGLVESMSGQGTFVTRNIDPFVTLRSPQPEIGVGEAGEQSAAYLSRVGEKHRQARATAPRVAVMSCPREIALRLRIRPGEQVISRHQVRYIDEIPWLLQSSFFPFAQTFSMSRGTSSVSARLRSWRCRARCRRRRARTPGPPQPPARVRAG